jgi:hypothetical protein
MLGNTARGASSPAKPAWGEGARGAGRGGSGRARGAGARPAGGQPPIPLPPPPALPRPGPSCPSRTALTFTMPEPLSHTSALTWPSSSMAGEGRGRSWGARAAAETRLRAAAAAAAGRGSSGPRQQRAWVGAPAQRKPGVHRGNHGAIASQTPTRGRAGRGAHRARRGGGATTCPPRPAPLTCASMRETQSWVSLVCSAGVWARRGAIAALEGRAGEWAEPTACLPAVDAQSDSPPPARPHAPIKPRRDPPARLPHRRAPRA